MGDLTRALRCRRVHGPLELAVDLSAGMLRIAAEWLDGHLVQGDLRALPLAAGCLDGIWNVAAMLHIPERETLTVLHEFRRVMKTSGSLGLVTALGDGSAHEAVAYASDESRWFVYRNQASLMTLMKDVGFVVQSEALIQGN